MREESVLRNEPCVGINSISLQAFDLLIEWGGCSIGLG